MTDLKQKYFRYKNIETKREIHQDVLKPILQKEAIRLLDSDWLLSYEGDTIFHRQQLETMFHDAPFISVDELIDKTPYSANYCNRIIAVSHMWLNDDHPDPHGTSLRAIQQALRLFAGEREYGQFFELSSLYQPLKTEAIRRGKRRFGIFWDYASLYQKQQHCFCCYGRQRFEQAMFNEGLGGIPYLYLHPDSFVFQITSLPKNHQPFLAHNRRDYYQRGWTFTEYCWSSLVKRASWKVYDLSQFGDATSFEELQVNCTTGLRRTPILPEKFNEQAEALSFFDPKYDRPKIKDLYKLSFQKVFRRIESLDYGNSGWTDTEGEQIVHLLGQQKQVAPHLQALYLHGNKLTNEFCRSLVEALKFTSLVELDLRGNPLGDSGVGILLSTISFSQIKTLGISKVCLTKNGPDVGASVTLLPGDFRLEKLDVSENMILDQGITSLMDILLTRSIKINHIGLRECGIKSSSVFEREHNTTELNSIDLRNNNLGSTFAASFAACLQHYNIIKLWMCENCIGDSGLKSLVPALGNVQVLGIRKIGLTTEGCHLLRETKRVVEIDVSFNEIQDAGAATIFRELPELKRVMMMACGLTNMACTHIINNASSQLKHLQLRGNNIKQVAPLENIVQAFPSLEYLDIRGTNVDDDMSTLKRLCVESARTSKIWLRCDYSAA